VRCRTPQMLQVDGDLVGPQEVVEFSCTKDALYVLV
jgi:diacylglycerol kinase family enzyme